MILGRIWSSGPESRLLPAEKLHVPTVAVMAIMTFAMIVVGAAGLALANAAGLVSAGVQDRYIVQIPAQSASDLARALEVAKAAPGVRSATPIPEQEMRETLQRWIGEAASSRDLPVPALITLDLALNADASVVERVMRGAVPSAQFLAEAGHLQPVLRSIQSLQWLSVALVLLMATATAAAIVLAARGALDTHRSTIEIMHGIGATDRQLTRLFERKIAVDALAGAASGTLLAVIVGAAIGGGIAALAGELALASPLRPIDVLFLAIVPVAAVALAIGVAHWTLLKALRATL